MIKHKCNLIKLFGFDGITFGDHVFLSDKGYDNAPLLRHEQVHCDQYKRYGFFGFIGKYLVETMKNGYANNSLEIEARRAEIV